MSSEERDKQFDAVLGRHVRRNLRDATPEELRTNCPDAEILAAYHERSLSPEEMALWKAHIANCANCQELLAQLEATDEILVPEDVFHEVRDAVLVDRGVAVPMAAVPMLSRAARPVASPEVRQNALAIDAKPPRKIIRWMIPAGAIAASLLVWAVVQENRTDKLTKSAAVQTAENRRDEAAALKQHQAANELQAGDALSENASRTEKEIAPAPTEKRRGDPLPSMDGLSTPRLPSGASPNPKMAMRGRSSADSFAAATPAVPLQSSSSAAAVEADAPVLNAPAASPTPPVMADKAPAPAPLYSRSTLGAVDSKKKSEKTSTAKSAVGAAAAQAALAPSRDVTGGGSMRYAAAHNASIVVSPGLTVMWRLGAAGVIEFTSDGGRTWKLQQSFVTTDLTAGSAPTDTICWIVGTHGTILLTVDGGTNWQKVTSPVADHLGGVRATDGLRATVWDSGQENTYATTDGGLTWKPATNE